MDLTTQELTFTSDLISSKPKAWIHVLSELIGKPNISVLEIGSYEGKSAIWFLTHILTGTGSTITCIDHWHNVPFNESLFDKNIAAINCSHKVRKIKGYSNEELMKLYGEKYDVIFIDGDHSAWGCLSDMVISWSLLKNKGYMIIDDYIWDTTYKKDMNQWERPKLAIDSFMNCYVNRFEIMHKDMQVILKKTTGDIGPWYAPYNPQEKSDK
ncbi:MAG: class I SAM-dependent methyltransferase [Kiritimatiellales bacterium]|nr:class I SAM-dependent methyltransferase [Kiritimatiellales bacterium]